MDENRLEGTARNLGGKIEEGVGRATGDVKIQGKGMANQVAGDAQYVYGQAADATRSESVKLDQWVRNAIETQPYTSALVALGIGWFLGRMHRPL
ncbi:MAG TPA: CsbD family protein [Xanthobacteraceae bacterium]|jgi:uncharacterized protein YjbJ (UPF0337 family)